ncbi:hypothetical protein OROHE_018646 [Orobanche hederae]
MNFLRYSHSSHIRRCHHHHHHQARTLYDAVSTLKCPRDRGLDHAVERERHLKPLLNLKNIIISEPSKSIPLTLISQSKEALGIPFRPIEFIRKYPSIFQEFHPGSLNIQPHIKLTPEIISLNSEEKLLYQSVNYKQEIARRLLKLLMISKINKIPIFLLEKLKWELGLPQDYEKDIIPEFPDYFRVINGDNFGKNGKILELVCWTEEFAVSEMENKGAKDRKTQFLLQYSKEFEMDKKYKKWVDDWQKLPYISPYENATNLGAKSDESDKWAVSVLHELLNLFVGRKAERDILLYLGEYFGLRSRFKLAFLQHPGIFYVSSKIGTHTVVLKEAYKRGMLIERHPLMDMRFKYVQLMNMVKDEEKSKSAEKRNGNNDKKGSERKEPEGCEEDSDERYDSSDEDEDDDCDEGFEGENVSKKGRFERKGEDFEEKSSRRNVTRGTNGRSDDEDNYNEGFEGESVSRKGTFKRKSERFEEKNSRGNVTRRINGRRDEKENYNEGFEGENVRKRGINRKGADYEGKDFRRNITRMTNRRRVESDNNNDGFEGENASKRGRFQRKGENFEENNSRRNVARTSGRTYKNDHYNEGFGSENASKRGGFKRKGAEFEGNDSRRNVTRRDNGRTDENGSHNHGFEGENASKRGRFKRKDADFEEKSHRRDETRRSNGRNNEENAYKSSTRFSRREHVRGGDPNIPRLRTRKLDISVSKAVI